MYVFNNGNMYVSIRTYTHTCVCVCITHPGFFYQRIMFFSIYFFIILYRREYRIGRHVSVRLGLVRYAFYVKCAILFITPEYVFDYNLMVKRGEPRK